jgi:Protein of unknown function (DUF2877)
MRDYAPMQSLNTLSLAPNVNNWLIGSKRPRILHVFDQACNLINERREVLSIVTPQIGNGPFNLVIEDDVLFFDHLSLQSQVSISPDQLTLGDLTINTKSAELWNPHPDWKLLHSQKENILSHLTQLPITNYPFPHSQFSNSLVANLCSSLVEKDISTAKSFASKLAGLGIGLTPSGDDFIMGALYAVRIIHPLDVASVVAKEIAEIAAPLTTSLSAAWLRSAGKGEAGILWHDLFNALSAGKNYQLPITKLLSVGETSGADALAGFLGTLISYVEVDAKPCPS